MAGNIVLLACGFAGGFIIGFLIAAEIGRQVYDRKMAIIDQAVTRMEKRMKRRIRRAATR